MEVGQQLDHPGPLGRKGNASDCPETWGALQECFYLGRVCSGQWRELSESGPTVDLLGPPPLPLVFASVVLGGRAVQLERKEGCGRRLWTGLFLLKEVTGNQGNWQEPGMVVTFGAQKHFSCRWEPWGRHPGRGSPPWTAPWQAAGAGGQRKPGETTPGQSPLPSPGLSRPLSGGLGPWGRAGWEAQSLGLISVNKTEG